MKIDRKQDRNKKAKQSIKDLNKKISELEKESIKFSKYTGHIALTSYFIIIAGRWIFSTVGNLATATIISGTVAMYTSPKNFPEIPYTKHIDSFYLQAMEKKVIKEVIKIPKPIKYVYKENKYDKVIIDEGNGVFSIKDR